MTDERLRELYARAMNARDGCITPDDMLLLVQQRGDERGRLDLLDHVMTCAECRREFDLIRTVETAGMSYAGDDVAVGGTDAGAHVLPMQRTRWHHVRWRDYNGLLVAAVVLVAVGTGIATLRKHDAVRNSESDIVRGAPGTSGGGSISVIAPAAEAEVAAPVRLLWHSVPGASRYTVEVLDANGAVVAGGSGPDTVLAVPTRLLRSGADYSWWVRAGTESGEIDSPLRRFRLASAK